MDIDVWIRHQVSGSAIISKEEEDRLITAWLDHGDRAARDTLILAHQKLVASMATRFSGAGAGFADMFNEGMIALVLAADRFDRDKGNRFSTYAAWWILSQLQEAAHRDIYTVKVGRSRMEKKVLRLLGTARKIMGQNLDTSVINRISSLTGADVAVIEQIDGAISSRSVSLNAQVGNDGEQGTEIGDMIEDTDARATGGEASVLTLDQRTILEGVLDHLSDRRAPMILRSRWLDKEERSLKEIGEDLNISAERVRQIENEAMRQIRALLSERGLNFPDLVA